MNWVTEHFDTVRPQWLVGMLLVAVVLAFAVITAVRYSRPRRALAAALRTAVVVLLVLALAGLLYRGKTTRQFFVFAVDRSASVGAEGNGAADQFLREAVAPIPEGDYAVVNFAGRAGQRQAPAGELDVMQTAPAEAVRLAATLMPPEHVPRIVLLSDGQQSRGDVVAAARNAQVPIDVVPLPPDPWPEVRVAAVAAPELAGVDEAVQIAVTVEANRPCRGHIELFEKENVVARREVELAAGLNEVRLSTVMREKEFAIFDARLVGFADTDADNNTGRGAVRGVAPARILLVAGQPTPAVERLQQQLVGEGVEVVVRRPRDFLLPSERLEMFDGVFLAEVGADQVGTEDLELLDRFVSDHGGGLVVRGGDTTFAADKLSGSGLEAMLPVKATRFVAEDTETLALVLVIDKSSSMRDEQRMELARQAAQQCVDLDLLSADDRVGVLAFGDDSQWVSPLVPCRDKKELKKKIAGLKAAGTTEMYPALMRAYLALGEVSADRRHVIVLTDGVPSPGDFGRLAAKMAEAGITVSTVSISRGADQTIVREIARVAGGRHYHCDDPAEIPEVLVADTKQAAAARSYVPQVYSELQGLDVEGMPPLERYALTSPRPDSELVLLIGLGDPLLAWRQHGKGITVAFTSADTASAADAWQQWDGAGRFWAGLSRHAIRHVEPRPAAALPPIASSDLDSAEIPEELKPRPVNEELLRHVAEVTGGKYNPRAAEIFASDGRTAVFVTPMWRYLLMICAVVFVADVAVRRWRHDALAG